MLDFPEMTGHEFVSETTSKTRFLELRAGFGNKHVREPRTRICLKTAHMDTGAETRVRSCLDFTIFVVYDFNIFPVNIEISNK